MWVWSLGQKDPPEKEMATHSSILAWEIPWTEEPGGLQFMGLQRVRHDYSTDTAATILGMTKMKVKWKSLSRESLTWTMKKISTVIHYVNQWCPRLLLSNFNVHMNHLEILKLQILVQFGVGPEFCLWQAFRRCWRGWFLFTWFCKFCVTGKWSHRHFSRTLVFSGLYKR